MKIPAVLLCADAPVTRCVVGGLPLLTRHILELYRLGVTEFYLVGVAEMPQAIQHPRLPDDIVFHVVPYSPKIDLPQQLRALLGTPQDVLVLWSPWLIDPRFLAALLSTPYPQWLSAPGAATEATPIAARLSPMLLTTWGTTGLAQCLQDCPVLDPATLTSYSATHRGPVSFFRQLIASSDDAVAATKMLISRASKRTIDVVAHILDTLLVNRLVFLLCSSRITPNQVTLGTAVLGALVAWLFLHGWLRWGGLLAYAAVTLDGVDGKLARTTLQFSRVGELEHVLDFFMEQAWYFTLTLFLAAHTGRQELWWIGGGLMGCDLLLKLLGVSFHALFGKKLEELGPFDRWVRRFGGRRNIYMTMLCIGFWAGFSIPALTLALAWAVLTLAVNLNRAVYHMCQRSAVA